MAQAATSDGEQRSNVEQQADTPTQLLTVALLVNCDHNYRVPAMILLCAGANSHGKSVAVPAQSSSWDVGFAMKYFPPLCTAYSLPVPSSLDYSAFVPLYNQIATAIG